jgi:hypothetical protein
MISYMKCQMGKDLILLTKCLIHFLSVPGLITPAFPEANITHVLRDPSAVC